MSSVVFLKILLFILQIPKVSDENHVHKISAHLPPSHIHSFNEI